MEVLKDRWWPSPGFLNESKLRRRNFARLHTQTKEPPHTTEIEDIDLLRRMPSSSAVSDSSSDSVRVLCGIRYFQYNKALPSDELTSALCGSSINSIAEEDGRRWCCSAQPQLPFLLLTDKLGKENIDFFCLSDGSVHGVKLSPELRGGRCVGSSHGWLLMSDAVPIKSNSFLQNILMLKKKVQIENFLFNPFQKATVQLPSQTTVPFYSSDCLSFIQKAALSGAPTSDNVAAGKCAVAILLGGGKLAFCRPGDPSWTILDAAEKGLWYVDIVFYDGKLHAISHNEQLSIFNELGGGEVKRVNMIPPTNRDLIVPLCFVDGQKVLLGEGKTIYLVESDGKLIMVLRFWKFDPEYKEQLFCPIRAVQFKVFMLDSRSPQWVEIESLGDQMLFLGTNCSKSYSATDFPGSAGNSIYYTDDNFDGLDDELRPSEFRDLGVFRLDKGSIEPCFLSSFSSFLSRYIWIEPSYVD